MRSFALQGQQQKDVQGRSELEEDKNLGDHTAPMCPMKENIWEATTAVQKKKKTSASDLRVNPMFCVKN